MACCDTPPVLEASKHDFDVVAVFVSALVVSDGHCSGFSFWNAGRNPFFRQNIPKPVGIITPVCQKPFCLGEAVQQGSRLGSFFTRKLEVVRCALSGASRRRSPFRLTKIIPPSTRQSSTRGLPWLFGKRGADDLYVRPTASTGRLYSVSLWRLNYIFKKSRVPSLEKRFLLNAFINNPSKFQIELLLSSGMNATSYTTSDRLIVSTDPEHRLWGHIFCMIGSRGYGIRMSHPQDHHQKSSHRDDYE